MILLATGCAGFIGSNFVHFYLRLKPECKIIGLDKLTYAGNLENLAPVQQKEKERFIFVRGDIANTELVEHLFSLYDIDVVVNFAAESHVDRSIDNPQVFLQTNVMGTQNLLEVARKSWLQKDKSTQNKKFIQISTDEVYGTLGPEGRFTEASPLCPRSPYAASKAAADLLARSYWVTYGLPVVITRCCNNYGPYQFPEKLIPFMIWNALKHQELPIYGDGRQIRDWLYVLDHCRALALVIEKGKPGEVYNIGAQEERENLEVVHKILAILQKKTGDPLINEKLIRHVKDRPGHDRRYALEVSKIEKELGWKKEISFEEGLEKTVEWYLNHRQWLERVISGEYLNFYQKWYRER
ncbi:dTDP-glucose 4,6-dehydratase [Thermatribacter velox]|uniref:dTDP-glucose 4,6-dehydratase n=1 Tax=Thermatribacter velox TaxID=3039681 RepID=A0ABZ2YDE4_9BACT